MHAFAFGFEESVANMQIAFSHSASLFCIHNLCLHK